MEFRKLLLIVLTHQSQQIASNYRKSSERYHYEGKSFHFDRNTGRQSLENRLPTESPKPFDPSQLDKYSCHYWVCSAVSKGSADVAHPIELLKNTQCQ